MAKGEVARNDITGDEIRTKIPNDASRRGWYMAYGTPEQKAEALRQWELERVAVLGEE